MIAEINKIKDTPLKDLKLDFPLIKGDFICQCCLESYDYFFYEFLPQKYIYKPHLDKIVNEKYEKEYPVV